MVSDASSTSSPSRDIEALRERKSAFVRFFELDKHIAEDWVRCSKGIDPYVLATLRLLFFLNTFAAVVEPFVRACRTSREEMGKFFFKLTHISALAVVIYFGLMTFLSFRHARDRSHWGPYRRFVLNSLHFSSWMFQIIICPIYWFALKGYSQPHAGFIAWWQDFSVHGFCILFLVIELVMVKRWYACWRDSIVSTGMILCCMLWMFLAPAIFEDSVLGSDGKKRRWWPYGIYRFGYSLAPVFYVVTLVLCILISLVIVALHKFKNRYSQ